MRAVDIVNKIKRRKDIYILLVSIIPFFISGFLFIQNYQIYNNGDIIYGEVSEVYYNNKCKSFDIKWLDSESGHVMMKRLESIDSIFWAADKGEADEFILYKDGLYPSDWTEFFIIPFVLLLLGFQGIYQYKKLKK